MGEGWALHQVVLAGGLIHDVYIERPMKLGRYLQKLFPDQRVKVEYYKGSNTLEEIYYCGRLISERWAA